MSYQCRLVKKFLRLSGVFHLTKRGLSGENTWQAECCKRNADKTDATQRGLKNPFLSAFENQRYPRSFW